MAREDIEEWADAYFLEEHGFLKHKTFSCPSYYKGGKMFAFLYEDGLGIKLKPEDVLKLIEKNPSVYGHFHPGEIIMKNWVIITHADVPSYEDERDLMEEAMKNFLEA